MRSLALGIYTLLVAAPAFGQSQSTLVAVDSKSMASVTSQNWNDNRFRAYWSSASLGFVDGFVRFDLSSIPDSATITGLTLRAYHEANYGSPANGPSVICYRVDNDAWSRNAIDTHPGLGAALTPQINSFASGSQAPNDFVLDVGAANWSLDLQDDALSLALRNENGNLGIWGYVYFYGSDPLPAPPELIVDYFSGPSLAVTAGAPGGLMTFDFAGFSPSGTIGVVYGPAGSYTAPGGACAGLSIGLLPINATSPILVAADANGDAQVTRTVPGAAAGLSVQAADVVPGACAASNRIVL